MRIRRFVRIFILAAAAAAIPAALGCAKKADPPPAAEPQGDAPPPEGVTETNDNGTVTWTVAADGKVRGVARTSDGKVVSKNITGNITWKTPGLETVYPVTTDEQEEVLIATVPPPEDDLTEMRYTLDVEGKPWNGVLYVPKGGTQVLVDDARAAAERPPPEDKKVGPHGGVVQIVGKDRVEMVADKETGQVRVYILDADYAPIPIGERRVKLAVVADEPEVVELDPEPGGLYFYAGLNTRVDPVRVTVSVGLGVETHAGIFGWRPGVALFAPGVRLAAHAAVPRVRLMTEARWGAFTYVGVRTQARVRGSVGVNVGARGGVRVDERVRVDARERVHVHEKRNVHVNVHENVHVKAKTNVHVKARAGGDSCGDSHGGKSHGGKGGGSKGGGKHGKR